MSETPAFKVGDVVRLKSGGPPMTVVEALPGNTDLIVTVTWFALPDTSNVILHRFPSDVLEAVDPEAPLPKD